MDQYITVTSRESPSRFTSSFNSVVNLTDGYEIAVKSVYHGPIFNVTEQNDSFKVNKGGVTVRFKIPHGFYDRSCKILRAAHKAINQSFDENYDGENLNLKDPPTLGFDSNGWTVLKLSIKSETFTFDDESPLFELLGCFKDTSDTNKIAVEDYPLESAVECGFLYSDVVKNSIINDSSARLMTCIPLYSKKGYSFYEFRNPDYKPLSVNSFTDLSFLITNQNGEDIKFEDSLGCDSEVSCDPNTNVQYPTILNLHIRRRKLG